MRFFTIIMACNAGTSALPTLSPAPPHYDRRMIRPDLHHLPAYTPGDKVDGALVLASNETSEPPLPAAIEAIEAAAPRMNRYPYMATSPLHHAIARLHGVTVDEVAIGCGSSALLQQLILATCKDGQSTLFAWRSFEAYPILSRIAGANPIQVPLDTHHRHDLEAMLEAITESTSLIILCNPNNPTGTIVRHDELDSFLTRVPGHVTVCIDEAYLDYTDDDLTPDSIGLVQRHPNACVARTFSKCYGLAGARVGYLVGSSDIISAVNRTQVPFSVSTLAHDAAIACLNDPESLTARVSRTASQRRRLRDFLLTEFIPSSRWALRSDDIPESHANFQWLALGEKSDDFTEALAKEHIRVRCFSGDGVRITVTTAEETDQLIDALRTIA